VCPMQRELQILNWGFQWMCRPSSFSRQYSESTTILADFSWSCPRKNSWGFPVSSYPDVEPVCGIFRVADRRGAPIADSLSLLLGQFSSEYVSILKKPTHLAKQNAIPHHSK
jgi:hypothetical protein